MTKFYLTASHFAYVGLEEFKLSDSLVDRGVALSRHLHRLMGPCWVRAFVLDLVLEINPKLHERLRQDYLVETLPPKGVRPPEPQCLSCPPWEVVEAHVLGGIVTASMKDHKPLVDLFMAQKKPVFNLKEKEEEALIVKGARAGLVELTKVLDDDLRLMKPLVSSFKGVKL